MGMTSDVRVLQLGGARGQHDLVLVEVPHGPQLGPRVPLLILSLDDLEILLIVDGQEFGHGIKSDCDATIEAPDFRKSVIVGQVVLDPALGLLFDIRGIRGIRSPRRLEVPSIG